VHPHPTQGGSERGCGFQFAPAGPYWAHVYNPCTTILGPETRPKIRGHPKPASKPTDTRWLTPCQNPRAPETRPETRRVRVQFSTHGCGFSPVSILGRGRFLVNPPRCHPYYRHCRRATIADYMRSRLARMQAGLQDGRRMNDRRW
jgi:hypothetical protein